MRHLAYISLMAAIALCLAMGACSGAQSFKIKGDVTGKTNTNLYVKYYGCGSVHSDVIVVRDGVFEGEFPADGPALVEIVDKDDKVWARMYGTKGDQLTVHIDRADPSATKVTGTEVNDRWYALMQKHFSLLSSSDTLGINSFVEEYAKAHPDDVVSALMFASFYDASAEPQHAYSIIQNLTDEVMQSRVLDAYVYQLARYADTLAYSKVTPLRYRTPESDSVVYLRPADKAVTLIALSNENSYRSDSVVPALKRIYKNYPQKKLQVADFVLFADTNLFKSVVRRDSAKWIQAWTPGSIAGPELYRLAVPALPFYIVTDSAGTQLYRGSDPEKAEEIIKGLL